MIRIIEGKKVLSLVQKAVSNAKREVLATMFLSEEIISPLPKSYHNLLRKKLKEGVRIKRLGFGSKVDYNLINKTYFVNSRNYFFRYTKKVEDYQRLIIIDRKKIFFNVDGIFFESDNHQIVNIFSSYFLNLFKKGKS